MTQIDGAVYLMVIGSICVVAAIVGGGLRLAGSEVPALSSLPRQMMLGLAGLLVVGLGLLAVGLSGTVSTEAPRVAPAAVTAVSPGSSSTPAAADWPVGQCLGYDGRVVGCATRHVGVIVQQADSFTECRGTADFIERSDGSGPGICVQPQYP